MKRALQATLDLLVEVFSGLTRKHRLVLLMEDGHWFDDLSRQALRAVAMRVPELILVTSTRPEITRDELFDSVDVQELALHELTLQDTSRILCDELSVDSVPGTLAQMVFARSGGHPLFVQQLAGVLGRHTAISIKDRICTLVRHAQIDELELPQSISGLVNSTLDRVPREAQIALKVLAVVGQPVSAEDMRALLPASRRDAVPLQSLDAAISAQLLVKSNKGWDFRHALIRQSIYEVMTVQQRTALHGDVADWLESEQTDAPDMTPGVLAFHNERAGRIAAAIDLLEQAGHQAFYEDVAVGDAIKTLQRLLSLEQKHPESNAVVTHWLRLPGTLRARPVATRRAHWQRLLGEAYAKTGEATRSVDHLGQALGELGLSLPLSRAFVARQMCFGLVRRLLFYPPALKSSTLGAEEYKAVVELVAAYDRFTRTCYTSGEASQGIASALRSTLLAERLGPSDELCNAYCMMSNIMATTGRFTLAREYTSVAKKAAEQLGKPALVALTNSLPYMWQTTLWDAATLGPMSRGVAGFDALGDYESAALISAFVVRLHTLGGNFDAAEAELEAMDERVQKCGAVHLQIRSELGRAELYYRQGNIPGAAEWGRKVQKTRENFAVEDQTVGFQLEGFLALLALHQPGFRPGHPWPTATRVDGAMSKTAMQHAQRSLDALRAGGAMSFFPHVGFMGIFEVLLAGMPKPERAS